MIERAAERAAESVRKYAFNKAGFFSGLKNDEGKWIFSDADPDGEARMYAVPNAFAVFSKVAGKKQRESVLKNFRRLKTDIGYKLFLPSFRGDVSNVGRIACGDVAEGLLGNSTVYNHGSQGFYAAPAARRERARWRKMFCAFCSRTISRAMRKKKRALRRMRS